MPFPNSGYPYPFSFYDEIEKIRKERDEARRFAQEQYDKAYKLERERDKAINLNMIHRRSNKKYIQRILEVKRERDECRKVAEGWKDSFGILKRERDELVEALRAIRDLDHATMIAYEWWNIPRKVLAIVNKAIAKMEGK